MGKDAQVSAASPDGADEGRLQYEPPKLLFRGAQRRVFEGEALKGVRAERRRPGAGRRFAVRPGRRQAASWADAINNPRAGSTSWASSPGMRVAVLGVADDEIAGELAGRGAAVVHELEDLDLLFYAADSAAQLSRIGESSRRWRTRARCGSSRARARRPR